MGGLFAATTDDEDASFKDAILGGGTIVKAYTNFEMVVESPVRLPVFEGESRLWHIKQYAAYVIGGFTLFSLILAGLLYLLLPWVFTGPFIIIIPVIPLFVLFTTAVYPVVMYQRRKAKIDEELFLFITRVGVISIAMVKRQTLFALMEEQSKDYGELAKEVDKIHSLISNWKLATPEACRIVARETPSEIFADFLDRLAFAIETSENPRDFFRDEQEIVIKEYRTTYESVMSSLELWREMFVAVQVVAAFVVTLIVVLALLSTIDIQMFFTISIVAYALFEIALAFNLYTSMPHERIWHSHQVVTPNDKKLWVSFFIALAATLLLSIVIGSLLLLDIFSINPLFYLAAVSTPLMVPGLYARYLEELIKKREMTFAAFLRTLGHSAHTKGIEAVKALEKLRRHDFGALTGNIRDLYARLVTRIDSEVSWNMFGAETQSDMISKFCKMYVEGARLGANTKEISSLISDNFTRILSARKMRYLSSKVMNLMLGVLVFSLSFTAFLVYLIEGAIINKISELNLTDTEVQEFAKYLTVQDSLDSSILLGVLLTIIFIHIATSIVISRIYSGGHRLIACWHVSLYLYLAVAGYIVAIFMVYLIG